MFPSLLCPSADRRCGNTPLLSLKPPPVFEAPWLSYTFAEKPDPLHYMNMRRLEAPENKITSMKLPCACRVAFFDSIGGQLTHNCKAKEMC